MVQLEIVGNTVPCGTKVILMYPEIHDIHKCIWKYIN